MPQVKPYTRQVTIQKAPTPLRQGEQVAQLPIATEKTQFSPEAAGAGFGNTLAQSGANLGAELQRVKDEQREKARAVRMQEESMQLSGMQVQMMTDAVKLKGIDAVGVEDKVTAEYQKQAAKRRDKLPDADMQKAFDIEVARNIYQMQGTLSRHETEQQTAVDGASHAAAQQNYESIAKFHATTPPSKKGEVPTEIQMAVDNAVTELRGYGKRNGIPSDVIETQVAAKVSAIHTGVIMRQLALKQDMMAQNYFDAVQKKDLLQGDDLTKVQEALQTGSTNGEIARWTDKKWEEIKPKDDKETVKLAPARESLYAELKARGYDEAKVEEIGAGVMANLAKRKNLVDSDRVETNTANLAAVNIAILSSKNGIPDDDLRARPDYQALSPAEQAKALANNQDNGAKIRATAEHIDDRTYMLMVARPQAQRAEARSEAAYQETQRDKKALGAYLFRSKADQLSGYKSDNDIYALANELGYNHTMKLLGVWHQFKENPIAVQLDQNRFNMWAEKAGLKPYLTGAASSPEHKAKLGFMASDITSAIDDAQNNKKGAKLTDQEKDAIMEQHFRTYAQIDASWPWGDYEVPLGSVSPAQQGKVLALRQDLEVTDPSTVARMINLLKSYSVADRKMSDAQIITAFRSRMEHAAASEFAGDTNGMIRILRYGQ